jgi:SAM-dependent methyltransferase
VPPGFPEGTRPSPNIWSDPTTYEVENRAADPDGALAAALRARADWAGRHVLDIGCGTGFHLPWFAADAARVTGVEPHPDLAAIARRRTRRLAHVEVLPGTAQALPLPDASVDVAHARWAYFLGTAGEPGVAELGRVLRPGGTALVVDNDPRRSTFGRWFRRGFPDAPDAGEVAASWAALGFERTDVEMGWRFESRTDLEAVVRLELPPAVAEQALAEHEGLAVDYAVTVWSRTW